MVSEPAIARYYLPEMDVIDIDVSVKDKEGFEKKWERSGRNRLWFLVDVANFNVFYRDQIVRNWIRQRGRMLKTIPAYSRAKDRTMLLYLVE